MLGAIAGDIIGSPYEGRPIKTTDFPLFGKGCSITDDSVLTIATAEALIGNKEFSHHYKRYAKRYPDAGYGGMFIRWAASEKSSPYNSYGNGSAMRVSPVGWFAQSAEEALELAHQSASVTHNHPEGIKGAQAVALSIWLAREKASASDISRSITERFGYDLSQPITQIRDTYGFDVTCQGCVPQAIRCAIEATSYEEAVRLAVSLGGDADTQACIAGSIAEARFGLPAKLAKTAKTYLDAPLLSVATSFNKRYVDSRVWSWSKLVPPFFQNRRNAALAQAVEDRHLDRAATLLSKGADPNHRSQPWNWPIICSAHDNPEMLDLLITSGADIDASEGNKHYTPLMLAVRNHQLPAVGYLLKAGADRSLQSFAGLMALDYAIDEGNGSITSLLIEHESDPGVLRHALDFCERREINDNQTHALLQKRISTFSVN